jgi:GNAT superfamily N-acetyltransferase
VQIRRATSADVETLDTIALESKAHWGYTEEHFEAWKGDLLTPPQSVVQWPTFVAEVEGRAAGFAQLNPNAEPWELVAMWVRPRFLRRGIGSALLAAAVREARVFGQSGIAIDSDPNAAPFYLACGARHVNNVAAPIHGQSSRVRPQFRLPTGAD